MQSYAGEYAPDHPKFPSGSAAAVREGPDAPVAIDASDIVYTAEDDQAIDEMLKAIGEYSMGELLAYTLSAALSSHHFLALGKWFFTRYMRIYLSIHYISWVRAQ